MGWLAPLAQANCRAEGRIPKLCCVDGDNGTSRPSVWVVVSDVAELCFAKRTVRRREVVRFKPQLNLHWHVSPDDWRDKLGLLRNRCDLAVEWPPQNAYLTASATR